MGKGKKPGSHSFANPNILLFLLVLGLSRHLGSPVQLFTFFRHAAQLVTSSPLNPAIVKSLLQPSIHNRFGIRLLLFPDMSIPCTDLTMCLLCSSLFQMTWSVQIESFISFSWMIALYLLLIKILCSFRILSTLVFILF